ncbi:MAG: T9SS type A sorting domain-containing protein [Bacteroidota bacterium]
MKKLLLIALVLTGLTTNAQYFHHIYGTTDGQKLSSGINTDPAVLGDGHFLVGHNGQNGLSVSRTDGTGNITGAPYFNNQYLLISTVSGNVVSVGESKAFEMNNGNGFGIIGQFADYSVSPANTGVFYLLMDPSGNVNVIYTYIPAGGGTGADVISVGGIYESIFSGGNEVYVTGTVTTTNSTLDPFAMMIDVNSGTLIWSGIYDIVYSTGPGIAFGKDVITSPYSPTGNKEIVIVGETRENVSGATPDGYMLRLDAANGNPMAAVNLYGTSASSDGFNAIDIAQSTKGGSDGYIIGGYSDRAGSEDVWLNKTDHVGNTLWATIHDYNGNSGTQNVCNDIIERKNTSGNFEYYAAGYVFRGLMGDYDILVDKIEDGGSTSGFGQFTYGDSRIDYGIAIDQYNGTGADGISVFGFREGASSPIINGNYDMYLVKAYFNGETPCNQRIVDVPIATGPKLYATTGVNFVDKLKQDAKLKWRDIRAYDANICYANSLAAGSNARVAPAEPKGDKQAVVAPNPMQSGAQAIAVSVEVESATTAQVAIYDMLGRQYYAGSVNLAKGSNTLPIDISKSNMSTGTYTVRITMNGVNKSVLLLVE